MIKGLNFSDIAFFLMLIAGTIYGLTSNAMFLAILCGGMLLAIAVFFALFKVRNTDAVMKANEGNQTNSFLKKYNEVNLQKYSSVFLLCGLLISLGFTTSAFNWTEEQEEVIDLGDVFIPEEIEQLPPPSVQKPPPPPPPPPPPKLEIVEDDEIIEEEPEILEVEAEEETVVDIPEEIYEEEVEEVVEEVVEEEEPEEPEIFTIVEDMPEFPGGQKELFKFLGKNVNYPPMARENGIEGTVYIGFVVTENGTIEDIHIKRGLSGGGAGCDQEAIRVVKKMPRWKPGKQRGKAVKVAYTLPFKFKLE